MPSKTDTPLDKETGRIDTLLAKWGIGLSSMGGARGRRRDIATQLAKEHGAKVTNAVFEAFFAEAKLRNLKNPSGWIMSILEDETDRRAYFPEMLKTAAGKPQGLSESARKPKHGPGDHGLDPSSPEALERQAALEGKTLSEVTYAKRRNYMWCRLWGDGYSIEDIAKEQGITVDLCRSEISREMRSQWDKTLEEWEADRKATHARARAARLAPKDREPRKDNRADTIRALRDAPEPNG